VVSKRIVVTGGSGFLGNATVKEASVRGHNVWSFDRINGHNIMESLDGLRDADTVIHLAGILGTSELFDDPERALDINTKGTLRILEWCRAHDARFVGITMPEVFPSVYTATKVAAYRLALAWHTAYDVPVSHVRAFNVYGPGQAHGSGHPQKVVPTFSARAWDNKPLPVWGDGSQTMDLVHVTDVARMLVDATNFGDGQIFDAGTGKAVTVRQFARFVINETNSTGGIDYLPMRRGEKPTQIVAHGDGWDLLDWRPHFNWASLSETMRGYRNV